MSATETRTIEVVKGLRNPKHPSQNGLKPTTTKPKVSGAPASTGLPASEETNFGKEFIDRRKYNGDVAQMSKNLGDFHSSLVTVLEDLWRGPVVNEDIYLRLGAE